MSLPSQNPFAAAPRRQPQVSVRRLLGASKGLGLVGLLLAVLIVAQTQTRRWLLDRWAAGFSDLPPAEQITRLLQIDALGDIAIETIAKRLVADDQTVAATAYQLLRDHQSDWSTRDEASLSRAHLNLLNGLAVVAPELHGERMIWAKELINQSLLEFVDKRTPETAVAYEQANRTLQLLSNQNRSDDAAPMDQPAVTLMAAVPAADASTSGAAQLVPLPIKMQDAMTLVPRESDSSLVAKPPTEQTTNTDSQTLGLPSSTPLTVAPRITQVAPIQAMPVARSVSPQLNEEARAQREEAAREALEPVRMVTQNSLESYSTKSVIDLLGSAQTATRDDATNELVRRGMSNEEIRLANQLASPMIEVRLGLLESIVHRQDVDPRPWMLWLAEDASREVRLRAISALGTMNDIAVTKALRERLSREDDATVSAKLNRILATQVR